jgi:class 3 adenylate cyclase
LSASEALYERLEGTEISNVLGDDAPARAGGPHEQRGIAPAGQFWQLSDGQAIVSLLAQRSRYERSVVLVQQ